MLYRRTKTHVEVITIKIELHEKESFVYAEVNAEPSEMKELRMLAKAAMQWHLPELKRDLHVSADLSWLQLVSLADKTVMRELVERSRRHVAGYLAEAVTHVYLGNDWRLVFEYNKPYARGDGVLKDETLYDVRANIKNRWGLSKEPKEAIGVYVLTHYYGGLVFLVGYATLDELKHGAPEKFGCFSVPINKLHPVGFLKSDYQLGLEQQVSEARLLNLQAQVC
jgi:hypothetical protein